MNFKEYLGMNESVNFRDIKLALAKFPNLTLKLKNKGEDGGLTDVYIEDDQIFGNNLVGDLMEIYPEDVKKIHTTSQWDGAYTIKVPKEDDDGMIMKRLATVTIGDEVALKGIEDHPTRGSQWNEKGTLGQKKGNKVQFINNGITWVKPSELYASSSDDNIMFEGFGDSPINDLSNAIEDNDITIWPAEIDSRLGTALAKTSPELKSVRYAVEKGSVVVYAVSPAKWTDRAVEVALGRIKGLRGTKISRNELKITFDYTKNKKFDIQDLIGDFYEDYES